MPHPALDRFGEFIIESLRDNALEHFDFLATGHYKTPSLQPLQEALAKMSDTERAVARQAVQATIDGGLHDFLFALTEAYDAEMGIDVIVDGENVAAQSDGLHGELTTDEGWFARFGQYDEEGNPK